MLSLSPACLSSAAFRAYFGYADSMSEQMRMQLYPVLPLSTHVRTRLLFASTGSPFELVPPVAMPPGVVQYQRIGHFPLRSAAAAAAASVSLLPHQYSVLLGRTGEDYWLFYSPGDFTRPLVTREGKPVPFKGSVKLQEGDVIRWFSGESLEHVFSTRTTAECRQRIEVLKLDSAQEYHRWRLACLASIRGLAHMTREGLEVAERPPSSSSSQQQQPTSDEERELTCSICLQLLCHPTRLQALKAEERCTHAFCVGCIKFWWEKKKNNNADHSVSCPMCRVQLVFPLERHGESIADPDAVLEKRVNAYVASLPLDNPKRHERRARLLEHSRRVVKHLVDVVMPNEHQRCQQTPGHPCAAAQQPDHLCPGCRRSVQLGEVRVTVCPSWLPSKLKPAGSDAGLALFRFHLTCYNQTYRHLSMADVLVSPRMTPAQQQMIHALLRPDASTLPPPKDEEEKQAEVSAPPPIEQVPVPMEIDGASLQTDSLSV